MLLLTEAELQNNNADYPYRSPHWFPPSARPKQ